VLKTLHKLGLDSTVPVRGRRRGRAARRGRGGATRPQRRSATGCAAAPYMTGKTKDGQPRATYHYRRNGSQAVVWQAAINPVVALELLAEGL
jgi:saccharopine dehydrogenase (NAD+, L-lysine forming)